LTTYLTQSFLSTSNHRVLFS